MRSDHDDDRWLQQIRQDLERSAADLPPTVRQRLAAARRAATASPTRRLWLKYWLAPVVGLAAVTAVLLVLVNPPPDPLPLPPSEIASVVEDLEVVMSGEEILDLAMESEFYDWLAAVRPDAG